MDTTVPSHEIVIARSDADIQQCFDIRIAVFHHEQKFPLETEIDEIDPKATHFLLRLIPSLAPIGTIRGSVSDAGDYYKLSRLAILKDHRRYKLGRELVMALHDWIKVDAQKRRNNGYITGSFVKVISHSQIPVKGFYAKYGYVEEGAEFDEDGDPHQKMVLKLFLDTE